MIPQLYHAGQRGGLRGRIGPLYEATSAIVRREINGAYALSITLPPGAKYANDCVIGHAVQAQVSELGTVQAFPIYSVNRSLDGGLVVDCGHQSYYYNAAPVQPYLNGGQNGNASWALAQARANALTIPDSAKFTFSRSYDAPGKAHLLRPMPLREYLLQNLIEEFGGEIVFSGFNVDWVDAMGQARGAKIRYGVNMLSFGVEAALDDYYTGIYPYYGEAANQQTPLVEIPGKIIEFAGITANARRIEIMDLTDRFESTPTQAELLEMAQFLARARQRAQIPKSYTIRRVQRVGDTPIDLGDTVTVQFEDWGVAQKIRIVALDFDVLRERVENVEVGARKPDIYGLIKGINPAFQPIPVTE